MPFSLQTVITITTLYNVSALAESVNIFIKKLSKLDHMFKIFCPKWIIKKKKKHLSDDLFFTYNVCHFG